MTEAHKPPYMTPDAVISMAYHNHKPIAGSRIFCAINWLRERMGMKPLLQTFLIWIIYREWQQHTRVMTLPAGTIAGVVERLLDAPTIRQVHVAQLWFKGRKSFGVDYDPAPMFEFIKKAAADIAQESTP